MRTLLVLLVLLSGCATDPPARSAAQPVPGSLHAHMGGTFRMGVGVGSGE